MLSVVCWKWGRLFGPEYVNTMRAMLARQLRLPHALYCVTDDAAGIDPDVRCVPLPEEFSGTPRCRRRMWQWSRDRAGIFGPRMLAIDLDVVLVDDITPLVDRPEPIVVWRVGYAGVYSGSFILADTGALHGAYESFKRHGEHYARETGERNGSDQAMLNLWLRPQPNLPRWTEADGFVSWFGDGYERLAHHGMSDSRPDLPPGARIVVLGSADKAVLDERRHPFVRAHWR